MEQQNSQATPREYRYSRRAILATALATITVPGLARSQDAEIWSASAAYDSLVEDRIRIIDVRSREEWVETGVARGAWPISLHEARFSERLFAAKAIAEVRPIALICATGGRSGYVLRSLRNAGYKGYIDISEGMLGSKRGPGWIAAGLPTVSAAEALEALPNAVL